MEWQKILRNKNTWPRSIQSVRKNQSCDERILSRNVRVRTEYAVRRSRNAVRTQSVRTGSAGEERGDAGRDAGHALHQRELLTYNPQRAARPHPPPPLPATQHNPLARHSDRDTLFNFCLFARLFNATRFSIVSK